MRTVVLAALSALAAAPASAMTLTSPDIHDGQPIPKAQIYPRCGGQNLAPSFSWSGAPARTKSFALTMIDESVKPHGWSHWIVVAIPPDVHAMAHGATALPKGSRYVESNFGGPTYNGPCPPAGTGVHSYRFTVWALPTADIAIAADSPADAVTAQLKAAALASASITGTVTP